MTPELYAYGMWLKEVYGFREHDKRLEPFLAIGQSGAPWLRPSRRALFLTLAEAGARSQISASAYAQLEASEARGTITINALKRAAEALDCELVYGIRPKCKRQFSQLVFDKVIAQAREAPWAQKRIDRAFLPSFARAAKDASVDPEFRRRSGWTKRLC